MGVQDSQPLTVSFVTGVVVQRDAISNICREQLEAVARLGRLRRQCVRVKLFALHTDVPDSRIVLARDAAALTCDEHFQNSHLIVYHFGIRYPLFDSILLAPRSARVAVTYHGITPPALLPASVQPALYESYRQLVNLHTADVVTTTSRYTAADVLRVGVPASKVVVLPNPVGFDRLPDPDRRRPPGGPDEAIRLVYIGRFVSAKGVLDVLKAARAFLAKGGRPLRIDLIGSRTFSDPVYLEELQRYAAGHGLDEAARFQFDVPESVLKEALAGADALLMPSHHEGFCVPVIEAMASGCFPICSDAGALPETSAGHGLTFAVGDAGALARRLEEFARARVEGGYPTDSGFVPWADWQRRAREYAAGFARAHYHERFWAAVVDGVPLHGEEVHRGLAGERCRLLAELRAADPAPCASPSIPNRIREALAG